MLHEQAGWYLEAKAPDDAELADKVRSIIDLLDSAGLALSDRSDTTCAFVACTISLTAENRAPVMFLDDDLLDRLVRHRLSLDFDIYIV